jgi:SAM-dependent methyltransferase
MKIRRDAMDASDAAASRLVERYRANYRLPAERPVTEAMVLHHWELERQLRAELLDSDSADRWAVAQACYKRLYTELPWLNAGVDQAAGVAAQLDAVAWADLLGPPPKRVYEVGSGGGDLIVALARRGYQCRGTEITEERGERHTPPRPHLSWGVSDGVHLERFEPAAAYDAVLSNQLIEHLHPDDLLDHLRGAHTILVPGGRYLLRTPQVLRGPADVSRVFGCESPCGLHLKEYTHRELVRLLRAAGFGSVAAAARLPWRVRRRLPWSPPATASSALLSWFVGVERLLDQTARTPRRRVEALARVLLPRDIMLVATKDDTSGSPIRG